MRGKIRVKNTVLLLEEVPKSTRRGVIKSDRADFCFLLDNPEKQTTTKKETTLGRLKRGSRGMGMFSGRRPGGRANARPSCTGPKSGGAKREPGHCAGAVGEQGVEWERKWGAVG